jgi:hypothetical protein
MRTESKPTSADEQQAADRHSKSYLARLFSPENLPQILLIIVGIGGIVVALRTLGHLQESAERQLRGYVFAETADILSILSFCEGGNDAN